MKITEPNDPYHLWYKALHLCDRSQWEGDVKEYLLPFYGEPYDVWKRELRDIFFELPEQERFTVVHVDNEKDANSWWAEYSSDDDVKLLYVNMYESEASLVKAFRVMLKKLRPNVKGRASHRERISNHFPLYRIPNFNVINEALECYRIKHRTDPGPGKKRWTNYDIGIKAGMGNKKIKVLSYKDDVNSSGRNRKTKQERIVKETTQPRYYRVFKGDQDAVEENTRKVMGIQVNRALKRADELISNAARGEFPKYSNMA